MLYRKYLQIRMFLCNNCVYIVMIELIVPKFMA